MDLLERPAPLPLRRAAPRGLDIVPRRGAVWRVARADGYVLGYIERVDDASGQHFVSKRLVGRASQFQVIGDFGGPDDAVESLRF
jgi:hypothetical protein